MTTSFESRILEAKEQYRRLWDALIERDRQITHHIRKQDKIATDLGVDAAAVSRVLQGTAMARSLKLLLRLAEEYKATPSETRILVALASALIAHEAGEDDVAEVFLDTFKPLFPEDALASQMISSRSLAANVFFDIGVQEDSIPNLLAQVPNGIRETIGHLLIESDLSLAASVEKYGYKKFKRLIYTYTNIVVADFGDKPQTALIRRAGRRDKGIHASAWRRVPYLTITRIQIASGKSIRDKEHGGYEFLFVKKGSGVFFMEGLVEINLDENTRQLIAYRPVHRHKFVAGENGAELFIVSYIRPDDLTKDQNPVEAVIRTAKNASTIPANMASETA